jgi:jasmonate ZIM domain-containing protein
VEREREREAEVPAPIEVDGEEMAASGNNRFGLTCAQVRQFMMERNRQVQMGDLVGSSSFQRPLQLTPVPVATGPAGTWDTSATTLSLLPAGTGTEIIR